MRIQGNSVPRKGNGSGCLAPLQPKAVAESSPRQAMSAQRRGVQVGALVSDQPRTSRFTKKVSYFIL